MLEEPAPKGVVPEEPSTDPKPAASVEPESLESDSVAPEPFESDPIESDSVPKWKLWSRA